MKIRYCKSCSKYTLKKKCPNCGKGTEKAGPGPYTFKGEKSKYRRKVKRWQSSS